LSLRFSFQCPYTPPIAAQFHFSRFSLVCDEIPGHNLFLWHANNKNRTAAFPILQTRPRYASRKKP
jgi:hypothetical protein